MEITKETFKNDLEGKRALKKHNNVLDEYTEGYLNALENYENLILFGVTSSIGEDTKQGLTELTQEQIRKDIDPCNLCIYENKLKFRDNCRKCMDENNFAQYYL